MAYTEAFQASKKHSFRKTAEEIISYTLRDLGSPLGAFYSAEDADSNGVEGSFYLWTLQEMENVLGKDDAMYAKRAFNVTPSGNYHTAESGNTQNILFLTQTMTESDSFLDKSEDHSQTAGPTPSGPDSLLHGLTGHDHHWMIKS